MWMQFNYIQWYHIKCHCTNIIAQAWPILCFNYVPISMSKIHVFLKILDLVIGHTVLIIWKNCEPV